MNVFPMLPHDRGVDGCGHFTGLRTCRLPATYEVWTVIDDVAFRGVLCDEHAATRGETPD